MFDRLNKEDSSGIKRYIGEFVSHIVVNNGKTSVEALNSMDRQDLAREWYAKETRSFYKLCRFENIIAACYRSRSAFFDDVAQYIDDRIPRAYMKYHGDNPGKAPDSYTVVCDDDGKLPFGLIHHYSENDTIQKGSSYEVLATRKQLQYLKALAWRNNHYFYEEGITKKEASECIDYFLNMDYKMEPECFKKHFKPTL